MERTIRVTGKGKIKVKPDTIRLMIDLTDVAKEYESALQESAKQTELVKQGLVQFGFLPSDLKTLRFHVDTEYERYRDEQHEWKQKLVGYRFMHNMKLDFPADNEKLGNVLYALAHLSVTPEFRILYTVSDVEAAKNQLLKKAVQDSKEKAEILALAAGVELGEICTVDYSWGELELITAPVDRMLRSCTMAAEDACNSYSMDIEPDDIDVTDTVTVVWSIKA